MQYLRAIVDDPRFAAGATTTTFLRDLIYTPSAVEVLQPGMMTTVQDYPGRIGHWAVGVPPSGPLDDASHRMANALVGNDDSAAALEIVLAGPVLKFLAARVVAVCGAPVQVTVDHQPVRQWTSVRVEANQVLRVGKVATTGSRVYIAVSQGGFDVSDYLGSKSTFLGGGFGGHQGRALRGGDLLALSTDEQAESNETVSVPADWCPVINTHCWHVSVLPGLSCTEMRILF